MGKFGEVPKMPVNPPIQPAASHPKWPPPLKVIEHKAYAAIDEGQDLPHPTAPQAVFQDLLPDASDDESVGPTQASDDEVDAQTKFKKISYT